MLVLTPAPLQTAAEQAFFDELSGWDTGGAVRGAVVASLPVTDGPMDRRQADAVVFVPEGLAVVRVVEVVRQSGVVTASPDGAWTIGPGAGPGEVLGLAGGGSSTLDGLMRAGMDAAIRLRRAGLEPGRIARLTVLHGAITGLLPADGDLGEGDQVALIEPRSLLLGIARAARHAGTDNPRLWTTADVRAALEALGLRGRSPSVEELNGEGFPYSPYVLRRPDLLTPAAMAAAPPRTAPPAAAPAPAAPGTGWGMPVGPLVDPAAAGRLAAAAVQADAQARWPAGQPVTAAPDETLAVGSPQAEALSSPAPLAPGQPVPGYTPPFHQPAYQSPAEPASAAVPLVADPEGDETGGIGGLFTATPSGSAPEEDFWGNRAAAAPATQQQPQSHRWQPPAAPVAAEAQDPPRRRGTGLLIAAALALVVVLAVSGFLLLRPTEDDGNDQASTPSVTATSAPVTPTGPQPGDVQNLDGVDYTLQVARVDTSCRGHAYGAVQGFFGVTDCTALQRALFSAVVDGRPTVVAVSMVTMPDSTSATDLGALADTDGSGNVSDLLREGVTYPGAPAELSAAAYDSSQAGTVVTIVETAASGEDSPSSTDLKDSATRAVDLVLPTESTD